MAKGQENWLSHALQARGWEPQRQFLALAILGFFIALILGGLYLSQVVSEATLNRRIDALIEERDDLERANEALRADIARLESVPNLQTRAEELGFVLASGPQIEYLVVNGYSPTRQDTVAPIVAQADEAPLYNQTFGDWAGAQLQAILDSINGSSSGG
ncbi:MAG: hypothetical protein SH821_07055 [Phototrophicales bacterium]|nr:hypothetical protein [Phototrophicales bacterium]